MTHKFTYAQDNSYHKCTHRKLQDDVHYISFSLDDPNKYQPSGSAFFFLAQKKIDIEGEEPYVAQLRIQIDPQYKLKDIQIKLKVKWDIHNIFCIRNANRRFSTPIQYDLEEEKQIKEKDYIFLAGKFRHGYLQ